MLFRKRNRELDEEVRAFAEMSVEDKMRRGLTEEEARRETRLEMGSVDSVKEEAREGVWQTAVADFFRDTRLALREMRRSPGFSLVAILTLALGLGVNASIFTLVHGLIFEQLPIANPETLVRLGHSEQYCCTWGGLQDSWEIFDFPFYEEIRRTNPSFAEMAAFSGGILDRGVRRVGNNEPARSLRTEFVSGTFFPLLGIRAAKGRLLTPADDAPNAPATAVLSHAAWLLHYGGDPSIVGSEITVNGIPFTVAGVAAEGFHGARLAANPAELWLPLHQEPALAAGLFESQLRMRGMAWLMVIGRLRPGHGTQVASQQLTQSLQQMLWETKSGEDVRQRIPRQQIEVAPAGNGVSPFRASSRDGLKLLSVASVLVLLVACANLANLLIARGAARRPQTALRLSLGASRFRLVRGVLTESLLLSTLGGLAGLGVAHLSTAAISAIAFRGAAAPIELSPSFTVFGFLFLLATLCGLLAGAIPAITSTSEGAARVGGGRTTAAVPRSQRALIILQTTLSVLLLSLAGMVTQSLRNLEGSNLGFETEGRLLANIGLRAAGYKADQLGPLYAKLDERLAAIPGVRSASYALQTPQGNCCITLNIAIAGRSEKWIEDTDVRFNRVSPRFFETMGTRMRSGREFLTSDTENSRRVAVVDEAFASQFFPGEDAVGRHFGMSLEGHANDFEIVGVVSNVRYRLPGGVERPTYFLPFTQTTAYAPQGYQQLETGTKFPQSVQLRVEGDPERYEKALRDAVASIDPNLTLTALRTYKEQVAVQMNRQRLVATLTRMFSLLALVLASIGLYGVTAYNVSRRSAEIGVRMALGAGRGRIIRMVLSTALGSASVGLMSGLVLAAVAGRYVASQLYEAPALDVVSLSVAAGVLLVAAGLAAAAPALRAASIAPSSALRAE